MNMLCEYPAQSNCCRLQIVAPIGMTQGYLAKLFNLIPGMEYCDLNESTGTSVLICSVCVNIWVHTNVGQLYNFV